MSCIQRHIFRVKTLYKTILKLHRGLPLEVQELGNNYVKDEFRRHKHLDRNSKQTIGFMFGWTVSCFVQFICIHNNILILGICD